MPNTGSLATQICDSLKRSQAVLFGVNLEGLSLREREMATVKAYANCREQGYTAIIYGIRDTESLQVSWAECRGSDQMVVYAGRPSTFDMQCAVPDRDSYEHAKYFNTEKQAARYIGKLVRAACKVAAKSFRNGGRP